MDIIFTHTDLDGHGCAAVLKRNFTKLGYAECPIIRYTQPAKLDEALSELLDSGYECYNITIADLNVPASISNTLIEFSKHNPKIAVNVMVFDHHASTSVIDFDNNNLKINMVVDTDISATEIIIKHLKLDNYYQFGEYVTKRDTGRWTTGINAEWETDAPTEFVMATLVRLMTAGRTNKALITDKVIKMMDVTNETSTDELFMMAEISQFMKTRYINYVKNLLNELNSSIDRFNTFSIIDGVVVNGGDLAKNFISKHDFAGITIKSGVIYFANTPEEKLTDFSFLSKEAIESNGYDVVIYVVNEIGVVELRSNTNGVNVAEIAVKNGGGGHHNAAGFVFK